MGKNKALVVPFALWAVIFIVVPLCLIVWYGVTVEVPVAYTEITLEDGTPAYPVSYTHLLWGVSRQRMWSTR